MGDDRRRDADVRQGDEQCPALARFEAMGRVWAELRCRFVAGHAGGHEASNLAITRTRWTDGDPLSTRAGHVARDVEPRQQDLVR